MWSDGRNREATAYHAEAVAICERLGLSDLVAVQAYHGRGEAHFLNLEQAAAIRCFQRSIELARSIGDKSYESENLMMVAYSYSGYMGFGDYAQARANFESALEIARARRPAVAHSAHAPRARLRTRVPRRIQRRLD